VDAQNAGDTGPPSLEKESRAPEDAALTTGRKTTSERESVKHEARAHLQRWLQTGHSWHLALARAKWYALRKGRV
jgi:hypothetical protein